ncbi:hypothetical protein J6590_021222 [Homalodisca vitripennis]|nr:hypothetical protein J6590_021222 [Homalodisca vitripennis]
MAHKHDGVFSPPVSPTRFDWTRRTRLPFLQSDMAEIVPAASPRGILTSGGPYLPTLPILNISSLRKQRKCLFRTTCNEEFPRKYNVGVNNAVSSSRTIFGSFVSEEEF